MARFKEKDRVAVAATHERGEVTEVHELADGPWAEQQYSVRMDGNDLCDVALGEVALIPEDEVPEGE